MDKKKKKQDSSMCYKRLLQTLEHTEPESEGVETDIPCLQVGTKKKAGVAVLISDKIDIQPKPITVDKEGHYIMMKSLQEDNIC